MSTDAAGAPDQLESDPREQEVVPEYEVSQYFPRERRFSDEEKTQLRKEYGWIRTYYKTRPEKYRDLQRWLNQARVGTTYDVYMTRTVHLAAGVALAGLLVGVLVSLQIGGYLTSLEPPITFGGDLGAFLDANRDVLTSAAVTLLTVVVLGVATYLGRYYQPLLTVDARRRSIDIVLPHAIVYMYALSYGGTNLLEVIRSAADAEDTYGEAARELDMIVRDMDLFGNDLFTAVRNARNLTPSDNLEQFLDDLLSVIDSGGDVTRFFQEQSENYLEEAMEEQEDFLETLAVLSEVFIFAFVAAPLFLIVTLMVISFIGGETLTQMMVLIYVGLPLGTAFFLLLIDMLSSPYVQPVTRLDVEEYAEEADPTALADDPRFERYRKSHRFDGMRAFLADPLAGIRDRPLLVLLVSVPVALVVAAVPVVQGIVEPSIEAFATRPVPTTTWLVVLPVLVATAPLSAFHERKRRRERSVAQRFPDTLNILSSANYMGIRLTDALDLVARYSTGSLAEELRKVRNDIDWNYDVARALLLLGNRLKSPQLTRSIKLIAEGSRSSGDISRILSIAAEDTRNRAKMDRARARTMSTYIAIVVIGFLVYLMTIVMVNSGYLGPIAEIQNQPTSPDSPGLPVGFTDVPVATYQALFFHSVLIQGFGAGILAGKLADNDARSGLKYSIALIVLSVAVFLLI